ncbi:MAG TPA: hypothetical protein VFJ16_18530 [Longimicrobium sp.]|nr:hypothetical protein [Longimicrobium sp.]
MRSIRPIARLSAAVIALSLASVAAAPAQSTTPSANRAPIRAPNQPSVDRALREFGFDPYRLRAEQQRALDSTWGLLYPGTSQYRTSLNSSQATALVYVALVHGRRGGAGRDDYGRGGWGRDDYGRDRGNGGDGWNDGRNGRDGRDDWNDDRNGRGGAQCVDVNRRVYDVENALRNDNRSLFVNDAQKRAIRESARDVQRQAVDRGWRRVADRAQDVIASVNENIPERDDVLERIQALKDAVDESCGQDRERRY